MLTVIIYKLILIKRNNGSMGRSGDGTQGLWQVGTMVSNNSKQAGCGERTLSIRGIQAMFAQAPQVALGRDWEGPWSHLPLPYPLPVGLSNQLPSKGPKVSSLRKSPNFDPPRGPWQAWRMFYELAVLPTPSWLLDCKQPEIGVLGQHRETWCPSFECQPLSPNPQRLEFASLGWSLGDCFFSACYPEQMGRGLQGTGELNAPLKTYTLNKSMRVYLYIYIYKYVCMCICTLFDVYDC